jgi:ferritin-like metal-binding protein YciE
MTDKRRNDVLAWIRDAHAMEAAAVDNLERLIGTADDYPALQAQLKAHLIVSMRQREEVEKVLVGLGTDTSQIKDAAMRLGGQVEQLLSRFTPDSIPKNCLAAYAYANLEIASYRSLLGAAEELGMATVKTMCERFIGEEQEIADFLFDNIPSITGQYLRQRPRA